MAMNPSNKINTAVLESHVKDVLTAAKSKLGDLNKDIDKVTKENDDLQRQVEAAQQMKQDLQEKNRSLTDNLKKLKSHNDELNRQKQELQQELKQVKDELSGLMDRAEQQKAQIMKEIVQLKETEKQLNDTREKERKAYEEAHKNNKKKIEMLTEQLNKKEAEINDLKMALIELNEKEGQRMLELEKEADQFKKIINNKKRDRTHNCGLTNLDFRTKGDFESLERYQPSLKFANFGTMGKSQYKRLASAADMNEQLKITCGFKTQGNFNPKGETTTEFYQQKGKKLRHQFQIGKAKETQLEEQQWTDKVFTGDNPKLTAFLSGQARERETLLNPDYKQRRGNLQEIKEKGKHGLSHHDLYHKQKQDVHAEAEQETQLVKIKNTETLEGKINLQKVKDIRRALRRRYATRTNFQKIFSQWDIKSKGFIDNLDIHRMLNKMGVKVNIDEANVLLASADQKMKYNLHMNEFMDLIFGQNDALNVDLTKIYSQEEPDMKTVEGNQFIEDLRQNVEQVQELRNLSQWKLFMQKNLNNISLDLLNIDKDKQYRVEMKDFVKIIERRTRIPDYLKLEGPDNLAKIIQPFIDLDSGKVNYKELVEYVRDFDYDIATNNHKAHKSSKSSSAQSDVFNIPKTTKTIFEDEYTVLDAQKVPPNTLESIQTRLIRVNRHLKKVFGTQENLSKVISESIQVDKNENISVEEIKNFVLTHCKDQIIQRKLTKKDIEGFLSSFIYNAYGATNINNLQNIVFTDENYAAKRLNHRIRANPPPPEVNGDLQEIEVTDDTIHNYRVQEVLQNVEDKVFQGPVKIYSVFRQFDKDGDGYVSYGDFEDHIRSLKIEASKAEIASIMKFFDKEGKGYLDFKNFATQVHPNMSAQINVVKNEVHLPNICPNKEKTNEYGIKQNSLYDAVKENRKQFSPDQELKLTAPTRFSSKPIPPNTFLHFQHGPKSPGFIPETERLAPKKELNSTVGFQKDDKERKEKLIQAKQDLKRQNQVTLQTRIVEDTDRKEQKTQNIIFKKGVNQEMYEKLCHIQSL